MRHRGSGVRRGKTPEGALLGVWTGQPSTELGDSTDHQGPNPIQAGTLVLQSALCGETFAKSPSGSARPLPWVHQAA